MRLLLCFIVFIIGSCKVAPPPTIYSSQRSGIWVDDFRKDTDRDWTDAIERALAFAKKSGSNSILFENRTYLISRQITVDKDIDLIGSSMHNTIITAAKGGKYPDAIIRVAGSKVTKVNTKLKKGLIKYDRELVFSSNPDVAQGDVLVIESKIQDSWCQGFVKGEYVKVQEVINNKVLLFGQLFDDYDLSEINIYKYEGTKSAIKNLTVIGDPGQLKACIRIDQGLNNNIENIVVKGSDYAGIVTIMGYSQSFVNVHAEKTTNDNGNGLSYGINIGNSQQVKLINCHLYGVRHALTFGGAGAIRIPNRFNTCMNSTLASRINYAASFHPNSEFCAYLGCDIFGGVLIRGKNHKINNCNIYNLYDETVKSNKHVIHFAANTLDLNHEISNNQMYCRKSTDEMVITYQDSPGDSDTGGSLKIFGNRINITQAVSTIKQNPVINFNFKREHKNSQVIFTENIIVSNNPYHIIQFRSFSDKNFHKLVLRDNELVKVGFYVQNIDQCFIKNNNIEGCYSSGIYIQQLKKDCKELITIEGNTIQGGGSMALLYQGTEQKTDRLILRNNTFTENLSNSSRGSGSEANIGIYNVKTCYVQNNIIGNPNGSNQQKQGIFNNIDDLQTGNNIWLGKGELKLNAQQNRSIKD